MNDIEIIQLLESREEWAVAELEASYGAYCKSIALRMTGNQEDAAEILNDLWLRVWESVPPRKPQSLQHYLAKLTRNIALDRLRREQAEKRGGGELPLVLEELEACIPDRATPESTLSATELGEAVERFLDTQSARARDVFLRRYYFAESVSEIAARYQMRESNVRLILSRTRARLKHYLKQGGYL